jgi:hypothetical protein
MLRVIVFLVLQAAKPAHQAQTVLNVLILSFFKDQSARLTVMMVSPPLDQFVWDAPRDVFSALKTSFVSTVLMDSICTMVIAMIFAQLELSEIVLEPTGTVFLAIHLARLVLIILLIAQAVKMAKDIFKHLLFNNLVLKFVMMVPSLKMVCVKFVTSNALLVSEAPPTVFLAHQVNFFTREDVGPLVPLSCFLIPRVEPLHHAFKFAQMDSTKYRKLNAPLVQLNALLAMEGLTTVLPAFRVQSQLTELAQ